MLKVAVIGVGSMGQHHARVYSELASTKLVAVMDVNAVAAERIGNKFGVPFYTDYIQMLAEQQPRAVSIAVPTVLHEEVATATMEAGAHVLIEKPIAATVEEGKRLIAMANKLDKKLMVGHIVRFNPATQLLKQKLIDGELGRVFQIICRRIGSFPARIRDVGVIVDLAPHDVDVMRFLLDATPQYVFAETQRCIHMAHEDMMLAVLSFPNNIKGGMEINWLTPKKVREVIVLGERGMFCVDNLTQDLYFYKISQANRGLPGGLEQFKSVSEGQTIRYNVKRQEPLKIELSAFVKAIINDTAVPVSGEDGLAALDISLALVKSGLTQQVVPIS